MVSLFKINPVKEYKNLNKKRQAKLEEIIKNSF